MSTPTIAELFERVIRTGHSNFRVCMPGVVRSYDPATQKADIDPIIQDVIPRGEDDEPVLETLPTLQAVPFRFLRGGGCKITHPVNVGDYVTLFFSDRSMSQWLTNGVIPSNPADARLHHLDGAFAIPGIYPDTELLTATSLTDLEIAFGAAIVKLNATRLAVMGETDSAALASKVDALASVVNALIALYNAHGHGGGGTSPPSSPASTYTGGPSGSAVLKAGS